MRIVIAGAGEVGSHLAKMLSKENQDIIVVDESQSKLAALEQYNLMTYVGSPTSFKTLKEVGIDNTDLYIAVTPYETRNTTSCAIAKSLGARKTVARIDNYEFIKPESKEFFNNIGVDELIYPEMLAAQEIAVALKRPWVRNWFELCNGELLVIGVKVRDNARIVNTRLRDLPSISSFLHVSAIKRYHETIIPGGNDVILANDIVYFATLKEHVGEIRDLCGKKQINVKYAMILGGSKIGYQLIKMAGHLYKFKLIENDINICHKLADNLSDASIIYGDGRDVDLLMQEGINECDAFISLSDSSETNILTSLTAKELGVRKTIAEIETLQFISQAENLNIGTIINKKLLASSSIFQTLLDSDTSTAKCLALADAEVAELIVKPNSKITKAAVKDLKLSKDMTIAGLTRDGVGMLVQGNTIIEPGDHVVVFCLNGALHKVEKLFN